MHKALQVSVVLLAAALGGLTWYMTLSPHWLAQSGARDSSVYYSQGIGLWLNYTEHVGDPAFDPGNSLWVPPQPSAVQSFTTQCAAKRAFCDALVGELHRQYCEVMDVYCGGAMTFLQTSMSLLSGLALLIVVWVMQFVSTPRRTIVDQYLMHLCIVNGLSCLVVACVWYYAVFRTVLETTFYKDQFNRCMEDNGERTCWHMGLSVYLLVAASVLYPFLGVIIATLVAQKFKRYKRQLRQLFEATTLVDLPPAHVTVKMHSVVDEPSADDESEAAAMASAEVDLALQQEAYPPLAPLKRHPSVVRAISVHEIDVSDSEGERDDREDEDAVAEYDDRYRSQVLELRPLSPSKIQPSSSSS